VCCSAVFSLFSRTDLFGLGLDSGPVPGPAGGGGVAEWAGKGELWWLVSENSPCKLFGHPTIPVSATESRDTVSVGVGWLRLLRNQNLFFYREGNFEFVFVFNEKIYLKVRFTFF
jgi:hypothetical protein